MGPVGAAGSLGSVGWAGSSGPVGPVGWSPSEGSPPGSGEGDDELADGWRGARSSRRPLRSSRAVLARPTPAEIWALYLPAVRLSISPPALSSPSPILSPCLSTVSPSR